MVPKAKFRSEVTHLDRSLPSSVISLSAPRGQLEATHRTVPSVRAGTWAKLQGSTEQANNHRVSAAHQRELEGAKGETGGGHEEERRNAALIIIN